MFIEEVMFVEKVLPKDMRPNKDYLMNFSRKGLEKIYKVLKGDKNVNLEEMSSGVLFRNVYNLWLQKYEFSASVKIKDVKTKDELTEVLNEVLGEKLPASKILKIFNREELEYMYKLYTGYDLTGVYKDRDVVHLVMTNYQRNSRCTIK